MNEEVIKSWRQIYAILKSYGYDILYEDDIKIIVNAIKEHKKLKEENERLLELCMYSLISSTKIYNHELANYTKDKFVNIIKNNLKEDTFTIREKIKYSWENGIDK